MLCTNVCVYNVYIDHQLSVELWPSKVVRTWGTAQRQAFFCKQRQDKTRGSLYGWQKGKGTEVVVCVVGFVKLTCAMYLFGIHPFSRMSCQQWINSEPNSHDVSFIAHKRDIPHFVFHLKLCKLVKHVAWSLPSTHSQCRPPVHCSQCPFATNCISIWSLSCIQPVASVIQSTGADGYCVAVCLQSMRRYSIFYATRQKGEKTVKSGVHVIKWWIVIVWVLLCVCGLSMCKPSISWFVSLTNLSPQRMFGPTNAKVCLYECLEHIPRHACDASVMNVEI